MNDIDPQCTEETIVVDFALPLKTTKVATVFYAYDEGCDDTGIYGDGYFAHFDDALWATARTYANEEYGLYRTPPKPLTWRKRHHLWRLHDGDSPTDIVVSDSPLLGSGPAEQPQDERDVPGSAPRPSICDYCGADRRVHDSQTWMAHYRAAAGVHPDALKRMQDERDGDVRAVAEPLVRLKAWLTGRQANVHSEISTTNVIAEPHDRSTAAWAIAESDVRAVIAALEACEAKAAGE